MQLSLINPKESNVFVVDMKNKPQQAIAMENPKLREYPIEKRKENIIIVIKWLLDLLGVGDASNINHHNELGRFINENYLNWTFQEIKLAFEMYVKGDLTTDKNDLKVFQTLNSVVFGRVMKAYREIKMNELDNYFKARNALIVAKNNKPKKLTEEEKANLIKSGVKRLYKEYESYGVVMPGNIHLYDYLYDKGLLTKDDEEKKKLYLKAKENVKLKYESNTDPSERKSVKHILEMINSGKDQGIKNQYIIEAKRLSIEKFMEKVKENDGLIDLYLEV